MEQQPCHLRVVTDLYYEVVEGHLKKLGRGLQWALRVEHAQSRYALIIRDLESTGTRSVARANIIIAHAKWADLSSGRCHVWICIQCGY